MEAKRLIIRLCVGVSFMVLGWYAIAGAVGLRHVPLYLLIAPTVGILAGLNYLRLSAPKERGSGH